MPVQTTYPGVYVQEVPSGVRTIVGVSTSVTAFVGAARQGPVGEPVRVRSIAEYVRSFGTALDRDRPMGHAIGHFFANGGSEAVVVRVVGAAAVAATADLRDASPQVVLTLTARGKGSWATKVGAKGLEVVVDQASTANPADLFGVVLRLRGQDPRTGESVVSVEERFDSLSMSPLSPRYARTVLASSRLVSVTGPASAPTVAAQATSTGLDLAAGTVSLSAATGVLRVTVDFGPPSDLVISTEAAATALAKAVVRDRINAAATAAGLPFAASVSGNRFVLTTTGTGGPNRSVTVLVAPSQDASGVLRLGAARGGAEVSGSAALRPTPTLGTPVPFTGGTDAPVTPDDVVPAAGTGGIYALGALEFPRFNLLCLPDLPAGDPADAATAIRSQKLSQAMAYCVQERAFLLVDTPRGWPVTPAPNTASLAALGEHAALYYPRVTVVETGASGLPVEVDLPPCGAVAGILARTDASRGIWKAPAGLQAGIAGIAGLSAPTDDGLSGQLNPRGVNVLRVFPGAGPVVWGARTLKGADTQASDFKYIPVRRLTDHIASSLYLGTQFAVFEPNDPDLWSQLRLAVGTFLRTLFAAGAFQDSPRRSERDSFFVVCDETVNPQSEIDLGRVNVLVGFAPLKPAEFVVLTITQISPLEA